MSDVKYPETLFVGQKHEPQFIEYPANETLQGAILASRTDRAGRATVAEYRLVRVVEAKMVADICCEVGQ